MEEHDLDGKLIVVRLEGTNKEKGHRNSRRQGLPNVVARGRPDAGIGCRSVERRDAL